MEHLSAAPSPGGMLSNEDLETYLNALAVSLGSDVEWYTLERDDGVMSIAFDRPEVEFDNVLFFIEPEEELWWIILPDGQHVLGASSLGALIGRAHVWAERIIGAARGVTQRGSLQAA